MSKRSATKPLGEALQQLAQDLGIDKKLDEYRAITDWQNIVGEHIGQVSSAVRISQGVLIVRVRTSVWRNELQMRKREIIDKLNTTIGKEVIKDIRFQ